jgi:membrane protease YdiL (CAAX protease family)
LSEAISRPLIGGAIVIIVYLFVLTLAPGKWLTLILPNLWLGGATLFLLRRERQLFRGGQRTVAMAVLLLAAGSLVAAFSAVWHLGEGDLARDALARALLLIIAVPLAEELYFRGLLLPTLAKRWGSVAATCLVSLFFAFLHSPQGLALPMAVLSLVLCVLYLLSKSVVWSFGFHLCWNAAAVIRALEPGADRHIIVAISTTAVLAISVYGFLTKTTSPLSEPAGPQRG